MMVQHNITPPILTQKQTQLLLRVILMMRLNQSIVRLHQTYKNHLEKVQAGLLIQLSTTLIRFQSMIP